MIVQTRNEVEKKLKIENKYGLHARASTRLAQLAQSYQSSISLARESGERTVDAKSVLGILSLGAEHGELVRIRIEGEDADRAMAAVCKLFQDKFNEE